MISNFMPETRVSVQGVASLGCHFETLCWEFHFREVKKNIFQKEEGNTFTLLIIFVVTNSSKRVKWHKSTTMTPNLPE
jgi:hypothetical protein